MAEVFGFNPISGLTARALMLYYKSNGYKMKSTMDSTERRHNLYPAGTHFVYYPAYQVYKTKSQDLYIYHTNISASFMVLAKFDFLKEVDSIFPPTIETDYKDKKYTFVRKILVSGHSTVTLGKSDRAYDQTTGEVKYVPFEAGKTDSPYYFCVVDYTTSPAKNLEIDADLREKIKQSPAYKKILGLHIRDISSPIQIKNETFAFGWRVNDNIYPPDGPANPPGSDRFKGEGWMDWFDKNGKFREQFIVSKNGAVRRSDLGGKNTHLKLFKSPRTLADWEEMLNFLHEYLVKKYIPSLKARGVTYWSDEDKHHNRDFVAIKTLFELNKSMETVMLFEEYNRLSNRTVTIPYVENGPLHWNKEDRCFAGEISELRDIAPDLMGTTPKYIDITYKGMTIKYEFTKADMDGSEEDTYGWNYKSTNGKFPSTLLIIND